jgi:uncharacterized membrane protein
LKAINLVVGFMNGVLTWFSQLPGASIDGIRINKLQVALLYVIFACLYLLGGYAVRLYRSSHALWGGNHD